MTAAPATVIETHGSIEVDADDAVVIDTAELRRRMPEPVRGKHYWILAVLYTVTDPEAALDEMVLDGNNLLGLQEIHCLWCNATYAPHMDDERCDGRDED